MPARTVALLPFGVAKGLETRSRARRTLRGARPLVWGLAGASLLLAACTSDTGTPPPSTSSPTVRQEASTEQHQLTVGGDVRSYRLFVPARVGSAVPVVVMLHDAGGTSETIAQATQFDRAAATGGFGVAYPESLRGTWNGGFCCGDAPAARIDDVAFLDRVVEELTKDPRLDPARIYLAGVSNGAVMAYRFACEHPTRIAGIASVAGAMVLDECQPTKAVSVIEIHGTADTVVPFNGGKLADFTQATRPAPSAMELVQHWAAVNGCRQPTSRTEGRVTTTAWQGCRDDTSVRLVALDGAGHTWYASEFGPVQGAVDATATIVDFFNLTNRPA